VNADGNMTAMYSTPSIYLAAKNKEKLQLPVKTDDFVSSALMSAAAPLPLVVTACLTVSLLLWLSVPVL
jgi:hypothetical protein